MDESYTTPLVRRVILVFLLGGLIVLSYIVLHLFLVPVAWAIILAYVTWPAFKRVRSLLHGRATMSALLMTTILTTAFFLPLLWLIMLLRDEALATYKVAAAYIASGPQQLPEFITAIPWLGQWLQELLNQALGSSGIVEGQQAAWIEQSIGKIGQIVGGIGRNAAKFGLALLTLFFLYRDGESVLDQVRRVLRRFLGHRLEAYLAAIGGTTKAVVYGLVLTALAQGALAGLGYWVAGMKAPALLAAFTALIALIPFGTPFAWGSIGVWLIVTGKVWAGVGLLLWGTLVVSWVDNLIRPLVISSATRIPFILVMFGVLGGLAAFGLVGLFLGPVILAVLMAVWREWLGEQIQSETVS